MSHAVVDARLVVKWALLEEYSAEAATLLLSWESNSVELVVSSWFACEVDWRVHADILKVYRPSPPRNVRASRAFYHDPDCI